jgi:hypothetical protein
MPLLRKRVPTFGREDRPSGIRVLLRGQSFFIRLVAFLVVAGVFLLIVTLTHRRSTKEASLSDTVTIEQKLP